MNATRRLLYVCAALAAIACNGDGGGDGPGPGQPPPPPPAPPQHAVDPARELMITNISVVNDARAIGPTGPWSFGKLMTDMAGTTDSSRFVVTWLESWLALQTVNGESIPARPAIDARVIAPWKAKDGQPGVSNAQWKPNLANAPFRLLAIVNRIDLDPPVGGVVRSAGEARFVFGVLNPDGAPLPFTVIFEYGVPATTAAKRKAWADDWHALGAIPFGPAYNAALQAITDRFAGKGVAPTKPNQSALNQLRTNEIALDFQAGWELREFNIAGGVLVPVTTKQTVSNRLQGTAELATIINDNEVELLDHTFTVPGPVTAAASLVAPPLKEFFWAAPGIQNNNARHQLAFLSCNGCHHMETATENFLHVANRVADKEAALSGFLTGITAPDPVSNAPNAFNDLDRRKKTLEKIVAGVSDSGLQALETDVRGRVH